MKFCLRCRGSISLFLSIILIPTLIFTGIMVDYANLNLSKGVVEGAGDLATNAALANYDTVLKEVYGLFAMSQNAENPEEALQENLEGYFNNTLYAAGLVERNYDAQSETLQSIEDIFLTGKVEESFLGTIPVEGSFRANYVEGSDLANAEILKKQIVEFMKYRGPAEVGLSILDSLAAIKKVGSQSTVTDKKVKVDESIEDLSKENSQFYLAITQYDQAVDDYYVQEKLFLANQKQIQSDLYRVGEAAMMYELHPIDTKGLAYVEADGSGGPRGSASSGTLEALSKETDTILAAIGRKESAMQTLVNALGDDIVQNRIKKIEDGIETYQEFMQDVANLCSLTDVVGAFPIEYPTSPQRPTEPGKGALAGQLAQHNQALESYTGQKAEYDRKKAEAEAKQRQKDALLERMKSKLAGVGSSICAKMKSNIEGYDSSRQKAQEEANRKMALIYQQLFDYYESAAIVAESKHLTWEFLDIVDQTLIEYAISKGEGSKKQIITVQGKNKEFEDSLVTYVEQDLEKEDGFHTQMKNQNEKYHAQFKANDVDNIIEQLECAKNYLLQETEPLGVLPYLKNLTFYQPIIVMEQVDTLQKATLGMKTGIGSTVEADIMAEQAINKDYATQKRDESWDMKKVSVIGTRTPAYYVKKIGEAGFKVTDGEYKDVPAYYVYLKNNCGMTTRDTDKEVKNNALKGEAKEANQQAKAEAEKSPPAIPYNPSVFANTPSEENAGSPVNFEELPDVKSGNKGTTQQYGKMQGYFMGSVTGLKSIAMEEVDHLLLSEYVFQNFSYATGEIVAKKELEEQAERARGYLTLTNIPISKENNAIYGCEVEYILYGAKGSDGWLWIPGKGPECNISNAKRDIFALRFMCNSVFTMKDSEIDKVTLPPALAIQASSSGAIPYQLVQTTFKLALALSESAYDLEQLMKGEKVALLKSKETFTFSPSGVRNAGEDFLQKKIDDGTEVTLGAIQTAVDEAGAFVGDEIREMSMQVMEQGTQAATGALEDIVSTIVNTVMDVVEKEFMSLYTEGVTYSSATLEANINERLNKLVNSESEEVSGFADKVRAGITSEMLDLVDSELQQAFDELERINAHETGVEISGDRLRNLKEKMQKLAMGYQEKFMNEIRNLSLDVGEKMFDAAYKHIEEAGDIVNRKAGSIINEQGELLSTETNKVFDQYFPKETTAIAGMENENRNIAAEKSFACSYEDYLRIFFFLKMQTQQSKLLLRTADVIQMNVGTGLKGYAASYLGRGEGEPTHQRGSEFRMNEAYTYVEIESDIKVDPLLISFELFTPKGEKPLKYWYYHYKNFAGY